MNQKPEKWQIDGSTGDAVDKWQAVLSETHLPWSVNIPQSRQFKATVSRWWIDDLALVDCTCMPCGGVRSRRELAQTDEEFAVLLLTRAGHEIVKLGRAETAMQAGDALVWDGRRSAQFAAETTLVKRSLLIPYAALDEIGLKNKLSGGCSLNGAAASTQVLSAYLDTLPTALPQIGPSSATALRNATLELLAGALRSDRNSSDSSTVQSALRAAMDRYIEAHLMDYSVTPAAVAKAHGVSVRTVNRVFNASGQTVGKMVQLRRLARARDELINSTQSVTAIALRWGFCDNSHFTRRFKAHYGMTPTSYREKQPAHTIGGVSVQ